MDLKLFDSIVTVESFVEETHVCLKNAKPGIHDKFIMKREVNDIKLMCRSQIDNHMA